MEPIKLKSNEYWGRRSGTIREVRRKWDAQPRIEHQFKIKRGAISRKAAG